MSPQNFNPQICRFILIALLFCTSTSGYSESQQSLDIVLFGQPCVLQGPLDKPSLQSIHSVSPEQALPPYENRFSAELTRSSVLKLKKVSGLPTALEPYREKLLKRLEGQLTFLEALEVSRKSKSVASLLTSLEKIEGKRKKDLETAIKKLDLTKNGPSVSDSLDTIFESYSDLIEPDPEEIFHRTIKKLNVQYVCSFEAEGESDEEDEAPAKTTPPKAKAKKKDQGP